VLGPAESELDELERFRTEVRSAAGSAVSGSSSGWPAGN
jgi:hypothetical protein